MRGSLHGRNNDDDKDEKNVSVTYMFAYVL